MKKKGQQNSSWTQSVQKIKKEYDVLVQMRDGINLYVDIYRPDTEEKLPALLGMSPYGKRAQVRVYDTSIVGEACDPNYIVPKGYIHIVADVRGSGKSEGQMRCLHSKQEQEDGYDLVEWIAHQQWCNGNVGMVGPSYFAMAQLLVAAQQPPHLKALFAYDAPGDWYRDGPYHGGILSDFFLGLTGISISRKNAISTVLEECTSEQLLNIIKEKENEPEIHINTPYLRLLECPHMNPYFFDIIMNPTDGPFYWERSPYTKYDKIKIPVFCGSGWYAYTYTHLTGAFRNYTGLKGPKKLLISGPIFRGPNHPLALSWHEYHELLIRWYDYWLKGIETGIMDGPPVKIFVMGVNRWRFENEWPLARSKWTKFFLRPQHHLSTEPETQIKDPDTFVQMPPNLTNHIQSLKYCTSPLKKPMEITGPMALKLYAAIDQADTNWIAVLKDIAPDGSETELTRGWLKASHRTLDLNKSEPWLPYHTHTKPEAVTPGEITEYDIEIRPTSNVFKEGHRIELEICNLELPAPIRITERGPQTSTLPYGKTVVHRIFHNETYQSYLLLPIIDETEKSQWIE
jgi:putative CocE/NonD family hydrolase